MSHRSKSEVSRYRNLSRGPRRGLLTVINRPRDSSPPVRTYPYQIRTDVTRPIPPVTMHPTKTPT